MRKHLNTKHSLASINKRIKNKKYSTQTLPTEDETCSNGGQEMSSRTLIPPLPITPKVETSTAKNIEDAIVNVLVGDMRPINMVDGEHFQNLIKTFAPPGYEVPSRRFFTDKICTLYDMKKSHVIDVLRTAKHIALTSDVWTSNRQKSYMCLTAHFISKDFERQNFMLSTKQLHRKDTAENLCDWIKEITSEFDIHFSKISAIVTDNAKNMLAAANKLQSELGWKGIKCTANTLQLVLKKGFAVKEVSAMLESLRHMVAHFSESEDSRSAVREKHKNVNPWDTLKLDQLIDASTRWNSCYDMLEMLEKLHLEWRTVLSDPNITNLQEADNLSIQEWKLFHDIVKLLEPFKTATAHLEGENHITISSLRPLLKGLLQALAIEDDDSTAIVAFKTTVSHALTETYFTEVLGSSDSVTIYDICYFLDPRYKLISTSSQFRQNMKSEMKKEMQSILDIPVHTASNQPVDFHALVESDASTSSKLHKLLVKGMAEQSSEWSCKFESTTDSESKIEVELFTYLNFPHIGISSSSEAVLRWWQEHSIPLPILSQLFSKYFCIPGTSATSEEFSSAGRTVTKLRSRITGEHVGARHFLHCNKFLL